MQKHDRSLLVKVCGMREQTEIDALLNLPLPIRPDWLGFIQYERSPRYAPAILSPTLFQTLREHDVQGILVTVNMPLETLSVLMAKHCPSGVQLHGQESVEYISTIRTAFPDAMIIKAISIDVNDTVDIVAQRIDKYAPYSHYVLCDTAGKAHGGTGVQFDWDMLQSLSTMHSSKLILAGGIGPDDSKRIQAIQPHIAGIDINSRFEHAPARKDISRITQFLQHLHFHQADIV